ncbi:amino acid ABC transporter permease [Limoniibacter endophyticus]|uniref:Amino acid ABC transporter permease n=1 Tax=Limoniibacter endophyticus TaxID=1565040 RepID=A0A8J3DIU0_9HYPH|nr:amino acid ABC transporter permease [Limoniibacter endophyticus]
MTALPAPKIEAKRPWNAARIAGTALMAFWIAAGIGIATYLYSVYNPALIAQYGPRYLSGLWITIQLVGLSVFLGAILSVPVAWARMSPNKIISGAAYVFVYFIRGTPLIAQTFLIYYGFPQFRPQLEAIGLWSVFRDAWGCALFAFTLNTAAYQAEILRGAIQSVPRGQWEGAAALGIPRLLAVRKIILPQAMIVALRPYANEIILMIKGSAIVAIITVFDLMGVTRQAFSRTFDFQTYIWAAIIYLLIVEALRHATDWAERRITRHLKR